MKTSAFRGLRRIISFSVLLCSLAFVSGCISIGFSGSGRVPFGRMVPSQVSSGINFVGGVMSGNVYRYGAYWHSQGVLHGIDPVNYLATSIVESMEAGEVPETYSPEQQYYIGRGVSAALVNEFTMANPADPKVQVQLTYLNRMAGFINVSAPDGSGLWAGVRVGLLESPRVAAFATPGGYIWVTRGALDLVQTEDELAALMCHELGHVAKEHAIKAYVKDGGGKVKPNPFIKNLGMLSPLPRYSGSFFGGLAENIANNRYGKDQEFEADHWAAVSLQLAGYDSRALRRLLERVDSWESRNPDRGAYLANHPPVKDRLNSLDKFLGGNKDLFQLSVTAEATNRRNARFKAVFGR